MIWKTLLQSEQPRVVLPWLGRQDQLVLHGRRWRLQGPAPRELGWSSWDDLGRGLRWVAPAEPDPSVFARTRVGYLFGDRFFEEATTTFRSAGERCVLVPPEVELFTRVRVGQLALEAEARHVFIEPTFPLGCEEAVREAFEDDQPLDGLVDVPAVLRCVAAWERRRRAEAAAAAAAHAAATAAAAAKAAAEEAAAALARDIGTAQGRRALAQRDFGAAARVALAVGRAEYISHRPSPGGGNIVRYRLPDLGIRLECVVGLDLAVIDSGICLTDHETGERGDTRFTLESLPAVVREADSDDKLVVYRRG